MAENPLSTHRILLGVVVAALSLVALSGCVGSAEANSSLYVKDALTDDVSEVHVTFTKAQAKPVGGAWVTVFEGKETIELLSLSSADAKAELASFALAEGAYEGLRIAVSEVEVTQLDGSKDLLNVFGNIVSISESFTVDADGIDILVDFDLDEGVDLTSGTYTPVVKDVQTSDDDADGDGIDDVEDTDDDGDGESDDRDDDRDGDGEDDAPRQHHGDSEEETCEAELQEELDEAEDDQDIQDAQEDYEECLQDDSDDHEDDGHEESDDHEEDDHESSSDDHEDDDHEDSSSSGDHEESDSESDDDASESSG